MSKRPAVRHGPCCGSPATACTSGRPKDRRVVRGLVRDREVRIRIAVEVGYGDRGGPVAGRLGARAGLGEVPGTGIAKDGYVVGARVGDREVIVTVPVEVGGGDREGAGRPPALGSWSGWTKLPAPVLRRMVKLAPNWLATARSRSPSPSRSATASAAGVGARRLGTRGRLERSCPPPLLRRMVTSAGEAVRDREIPVAVAVEVGGGERGRAVARRLGARAGSAKLPVPGCCAGW